MKNVFKNIYDILNHLGFNSLKFLNFFRGIPFYFRDYSEFKNK